MLDEKKILDAIETAIGKDSMDIVTAECKKQTNIISACSECKFGKQRPGKKTYGCIFHICPIEWGGDGNE